MDNNYKKLDFSTASFLQPTKKKLNPRNDILKQIYSFYDTEQEVILTKKANWKRYIQFLKKQKIKDSKIQQKLFKKSREFIRKISPSSMAYLLSHIPTKDLWYILSVVKDRSFRNESVGIYIKGLHKTYEM